MRLTAIVVVLCACAWAVAGDGSVLKAKAKLIARLTGKHHKRGVLSSVPPYKLGHDIPYVTHSVVKPVVVTYPPTASVSAVKVPLVHPLLPRYPVPVGHRVPVPHPHYGLKFPHHHHKVALPKPEHFHHHHHHVAPRPIVPVVPAAVPVPAPVVPIPAPTIARPIPVPSPPVVLPTQVFQPALPAPIFKPLLTASAAPVFNYPQYAPQLPYALRPGGAVQTSLFANYPRYPFYQGPVFPLQATSFSQIVPHGHISQYYPQGNAHDGVVIEQPPLQVEPTPALVHAQGEVAHNHGVSLESVQPAVHVHAALPEVHVQGQPGIHIHADHPEFHYQPGVLQAQPDIHIRPGAHVQPEVHLHSAQPDVHLQPGVHVQPDIHFHQPGVDHTGVQVHASGHPDLHFHAGQPGIQVQPVQPDIHFHAGQAGVQIQPGQIDFNHGGQPDIHLQPGVQVNAGQPDIYQPGFSYLPNHPQPTQPTIDNNGWSPVSSQHDVGLPNGHYPNDGHYQFGQDQGHQQFDQGHHQFGLDQGHQQFDQGHHQFGQDQGHHQFDQRHHQFGQDQGHQQFDQGHHQFGQDQGHQGYDQNANEYNYQNQLQHHIQQQLDQAQHEQNYNHQLGQEYGEQNQEYPNHQPTQEYGLPQQGAEGRSTEGHTDEPEGGTQLYHNHIPLGLQPPIDRPLEHFR